MSFEKKVVVLKQVSEGFSSTDKPLCGICRLETEDEITTAFLSFIGVAAATQGEYFLFILCGDGKLFHLRLGRSPRSLTESFSPALYLDKGFGAGLFFVKDEIPTLVAYRKTENFGKTVKEFKSAVYESFIDGKKPKKSEIFTRKDILKEYDDQAVATVNYYDQKERGKIESLSTENDAFIVGSPTEKTQNQKNSDTSENETGSYSGKSDAPYYLSVKKELDKIFAKFPEEPSLKKIIPESRWAKIHYSKEKYYVVGLVKEKDTEKYICYGVPSPYAETPPDPLKGCSYFVPKSIFKLKGDGFFIMFQDAVTGKCVKTDGE